MKKKWICTVCGYVHEGDEAPEFCPQCKQPKSKFKELVETEGALQFVDEHVLGVAKGVDPVILEGLNAHFMGECTEVGMYLAMSRQADREGYPEVAEAFKRYAWEEAEHAAKFADGFRGRDRHLSVPPEAGDHEMFLCQFHDLLDALIVNRGV